MARINFICEKCERDIIVETDLINPDHPKAKEKAEKFHACKGKIKKSTHSTHNP